LGWHWVQLVQQPLTDLLYQPQMIDEYGAFGGMRIVRGNRSTRISVSHLSVGVLKSSRQPRVAVLELLGSRQG
jgi:hypothetical protein